MRRSIVFVTALLTIIGAINWGLVGIADWNLVNAIFGGSVHQAAGPISRIIYAVVGLSGLVLLFYLPRLRSPMSAAAERRRREPPRQRPEPPQPRA